MNGSRLTFYSSSTHGKCMTYLNSPSYHAKPTQQSLKVGTLSQACPFGTTQSKGYAVRVAPIDQTLQAEAYLH